MATKKKAPKKAPKPKRKKKAHAKQREDLNVAAYRIVQETIRESEK
jgi:hypothetical protein